MPDRNTAANPAKTARLAAWVNSDPKAAPSKGQVFALLMPSKGGLSTGDLRATEAKAKLESMNLPFWNRAGLSRMNDVIRADKARREAAQAWLDGLLGQEGPTKLAPIKAVETPTETAKAVVYLEAPPESERLAALQSEMARLRAENTRLRKEATETPEVPPGMVYVAGHLRRKR